MPFTEKIVYSTRKLKKELFFEFILFSLGILAIILFFEQNIFLFIILSLMFLLVVKFWHEKYDFYFFIVGAVVGSMTEIICIYYANIWQYSYPSFLGIPMWLPLAWGCVILLIKRMVNTCIKFEVK